MAQRKMKKRKVVVTTDKDCRGVFCGVLESVNGDETTLSNARMAVYWSAKTRGVLGLASIGPQEGSRITPAVPGIKINKVTSIMDCTEEAWALWESEPWS